MVSFTARSKMLLLALLAVAPSALAQTFTDCNPLNKTDCPDMLALASKNYTMNFIDNTPSDEVWNTTAGKIDYKNQGAEFTINGKGDSPTIKSNFYIFFGTLEVIFKAAPGQGVVSSIVLQSEDLDEIDWEWIGGNTTHVQTNYFGKGDTSTYDRAIWHPVADPMADFRNYTVDWQKDKMDFYIDGAKIRTLKYEDAQDGTRYPQTPMTVRLGIWAGGDPDQPKGVKEWSGGEIDYDDAPYTMTVKSLRVVDASNATSYRWGDKTGSWESIELLQFSKSATTESTTETTTKPINLDGSGSKSASESAADKWNGLSQTAKISIGGSAAGVAFIGIIAFAFCCCKQRRQGKKERQLADQEYEKQTSELLAYRAEMNRSRTMQMGAAGTAASGHGIGGKMKRLSQTLGMGKNQYHVI